MEFQALCKPMLLIPYPTGASRGDQVLNAQSMEKRGLCRVLVQEKMNRQTLTEELRRTWAERDRLIDAMRKAPPADGQAAFAALKKDFDGRTQAMKKQADAAGKQLSNLFTFCEEVFGDGQEMLIFASHLAVDPIFMRFVSAHGSDSFVAHSQALMFHERGLDLLREVDELQGI